MGVAAEQMPGLWVKHLISNIIESSNLDGPAGVEGLMPRFIRRRSATSGHQVAPDEIDAEMYEKPDGVILSFKDLPSWLKTEKGESKDEPWARLNELATFPCAASGSFRRL